jgi:transcriptional regulator with XRE-family HTH domain
MQDIEKKKQIICKATGAIVKNLRNGKSQFLFASENDISVSIINTLEKGNKDPQLTTVFKLAEVFGMKCSDFIKLVENELPEGFNLIEK